MPADGDPVVKDPAPHGRRWRLMALGVVVLAITAPALSAGFFHDDLLHRYSLEGGVADFRPEPHQLYDFVGGPVASVDRMRELGYLPWLTSDDLTLRFFRPLSSLTLAVDHWLFGRSALAAHLHSLLWFLALAALVFAFYRRILDPPVSRMAAAIYLLAGAHTSPIAWVAARHALLGSVLTAAALLAYVSGRRAGSRRLVLGAMALFALGLTASETATSFVILVVLYELFVPRDDPWKARAVAAAPAIVIGLAYLLFYGLAGYGARGSGAYISPFDSPVEFAGALFTRVPPMLAELYGGVPVLLWSMAVEVQVVLWVLGALALATVVWLLARDRARMDTEERRTLLWLGASSVACLAPMVGTVLDGRLLGVALLVSAPVLASAMVYGWRRSQQHSGWRRWRDRAAIVALAFGAFVLSPLVRVGLALATRSFAEAERRLPAEADLSACDEGDHLYLLTASDPMVALYTEQSMIFHAPELRERYGHIRVLSMAPHEQRLTGTEGGFELAALGSPRVHTLFEQVYRDQPLELDRTLSAGELRITVLETDGPFPIATRFETNEPACLLRWDGDRLVSLESPTPGEAIPIPRALGPMGL